MTHNEKAKNLLETGTNEFLQTLKKRSITSPIEESFSTAAVIYPSFDSHLHGDIFLNTLIHQKPNYTGWPFWRDSRRSPNTDNHPEKVTEKKWQCFEKSEATVIWPNDKTSLDFWTIENSGQFYQQRQWKWDFYDLNQTSSNIAPHVIITRVAEVICICLSFAKSLKCSEESTLNFCFRWEGLKGKRLNLHPNIPKLVSDRSAELKSFESPLEVPIIASNISIPSYVHQTTRDLFHLFHDASFQEMTETYTQKLINRDFW